MHYLTYGMYAGIGAACADYPHRLVCHEAECLFDFFLNADTVILELPAVEVAAVVFDAYCYSHC